jgi:hypothetical protein
MLRTTKLGDTIAVRLRIPFDCGYSTHLFLPPVALVTLDTEFKLNHASDWSDLTHEEVRVLKIAQAAAESFPSRGYRGGKRTKYSRLRRIIDYWLTRCAEQKLFEA